MSALLLLMGLSGGLTPALRDSLLADTPGNREVWNTALGEFTGEQLLCAEYLFESIPRLDRLEMTQEALIDHIQGALDARESFYEAGGLPDSLFRSCILSYRIDQEPVTAYRSALRSYWLPQLPGGGTDPLEAAQFIINSLEENIEIREQGYLGGVEPPLISLGARIATPTECTVILCSSLKALGIASRQIDGWFSGESGARRRWLEVWLAGAGWEPLPLPWEPVPEGFADLALAVCEATGELTTGSIVETGMVFIEPPDEPLVGDWMGTVSIPVTGGFIPLDWLGFDPMKLDSLELGPGEYLFCAGCREQDGGVTLYSRRALIGSGEVLRIRLL